jgi:23S rRNA pseudouridine1911/1915/1917 synthase
LGYKKIKYRIDEEILLIKFLSKNLNLSIGKIQKYVSKGRFFINGKVITKANVYIQGDLEFINFIPNATGIKPIFESDELCFFDKPSGMLVHPISRQTDHTLLDEIHQYLDGKGYLGHRIDQETSGLVVVSKTKKIDLLLKRLFETREIEKEYLAIVKDKLIKPQTIDKPLKKNSDYSKIKDKVIVSDDGQKAITKIVPIKYDPIKNQTLIKAIPLTGRTHQIRVHLNSIGHKIVGDPIYGVDYDIAEKYLDNNLTQEDRIKHTGHTRLLLHSHRLRFKLNNIYDIKSNFPKI